MKTLIELPKKEKRDRILAIRITIKEEIAINRFCKERKIRKSDLIRYLFNGSLPQ